MLLRIVVRLVSVPPSQRCSRRIARTPMRLLLLLPALFLAADKQNPAAAARDLLEEIGCPSELPHRFIEIDDVNLIALSKMKAHLGFQRFVWCSKMNTQLPIIQALFCCFCHKRNSRRRDAPKRSVKML